MGTMTMFKDQTMTCVYSRGKMVAQCADLVESGQKGSYLAYQQGIYLEGTG